MSTPRIEAYEIELAALQADLTTLRADNAALRAALEKIASMADACPSDLSARQARAALAKGPQ